MVHVVYYDINWFDAKEFTTNRASLLSIDLPSKYRRSTRRLLKCRIGCNCDAERTRHVDEIFGALLYIYIACRLTSKVVGLLTATCQIAQFFAKQETTGNAYWS